MADLGTAFIKILPNTRTFGKDLERDVTGKAGSAFTKLGAIAGGALGVLAVGKVFKDAIVVASDLNEAISATGEVFGKSADQVTDAAKQMAKDFGTPRKAFLEGAQAIGSIGKASGLTQKAAAGLGTDFAKLAADLSSFKNIPLPEALGAIQSGLVGEVEPLRRFGVLLSEAAVQAEAARLGLIGAKDGLTALTPAQEKAAESAEQAAEASEQLADAHEAVADASRQVGSAEERLTDALKASKDAQSALSDARRAAKEGLQDLALAVKGQAISEERAQIRLQEAQVRLGEASAARIQDAKAIRDAELDVQEATLDVTRAKQDATRGERELAEEKKKGIKGSDELKAAQEAEAVATRGVRDAQLEVADAQRSVADAQRGAAKAAADASKAAAGSSQALTEQIKIQARASLITKGLADANGDLARTQGSAANQARKTAGAFQEVQAQIGGALLPAVNALLPILVSLAPIIGDVLATAVKALAPLLAAVAKQLGPVLQKVIKALAPVIEDLAPVIGEVALALGETLIALVPLIPPLSKILIAAVKLVPVFLQITSVLVKLSVSVLTPLVDIVGNLSEAISSGLVRGLHMLKNLLSKLLEPFKAFGRILGKIGSVVGKALAPFLKQSEPPLVAGLKASAVALKAFQAIAKRTTLPGFETGVPAFAGSAGFRGGFSGSITVNQVANDPEATARAVAARLGQRSTR